MFLTGEPAIVVGTIVAALVAVQQAAISLSNTAHVVIAVVVVFLGALLTRSNVTPTGRGPR